MFRIQGNIYTLVEEYKDGFNLEAVTSRYSDVLDKFDYLVGDWGYGQLRLKGFFEDVNKKAPFDSKISFLDEYILEYCNFGCAYFLLKKVKELSAMPEEEVISESKETVGASPQESNKATNEAEFRDKRRENRRRPPRAKRNPRREQTEQPLV
ncbi:MAG TPA: DUF1027 domain-containing protein [Paenibacillaceae bacterium]|nr:DUF1027 domain-containing protein [Paenibacillaceae bacterium]